MYYPTKWSTCRTWSTRLNYSVLKWSHSQELKRRNKSNKKTDNKKKGIYYKYNNKEHTKRTRSGVSKQQQQRSIHRHLSALVGLTDVNWGRKRGEYPIHCDHRSPRSRRHSSCNRSGCNVDRFKTRNPTCKNLELKRGKRIINLSPGVRCRTLYLVFILLMLVVQISVARARLRWGVIPTGETKNAHTQIIWRTKTQNDVYKENWPLYPQFP